LNRLGGFTVKKVIVELTVPFDISMEAAMETDAAKVEGFTIDPDYAPVPISLSEDLETDIEAEAEVEVEPTETTLVRGEIEEEKIEDLLAQPNVVGVWSDVEVEATEDPSFADIEDILNDLGEEFAVFPMADDEPAFSLETASPCPPTDCDSGTAKGTISDVAKYLRCDRLWAKGIRGDGVVIGICDSGVSKTKVPGVMGGWSPPGTGYVPGSAPSSSHGTMCAFDATGMAPAAKIYDMAILRSTGPGFSGLLSDAIAAYHWALLKYKSTGKPQILSNSWACFQKAKGPDYATNPNHPFSRKVVELINAGIIILFAAGNCGSQCPDSRCGTDTGPGRSIWGANGHPKVITVGAANIREEWIGYTSQGPAALDPRKPDFCAPSHFKGARSSDSGTSAATPICAGVVGLLKSHDPDLKQDTVKKALQKTAKNLCAPSWDRNSGWGMIQAEAAYRYLYQPSVLLAHAMWTHGTSVHEEFPDRFKLTRRMGPYAVFEGKPGTSNWFHFAIPTPVIVNGKRLRLDSILLTFSAYPDVWVTNIHIYDGNGMIEYYNNLAMTGTHWMERFDVLNKYVRRGVGVSIGVRFGSDESKRHYILFISAGGDFIT
jgi:subtilisin family serine protease